MNIKKIISIFLIFSIFIQLTPIQLTATDDDNIEIIEPETTCNCGSDTAHLETCPFYIFEETEEFKELTVFELLTNSNSLNEFWDIIMAEENRDAVLAFTVDEIAVLNNKVNDLFATINEPTSDDVDIKEMLLETLLMLPAMECPNCGEFGSHADDCINNIEELVSNPLDGMTLTANTTIGKQTLKTGNTVTWTVPEGITLTITGTILLQNNTKLVITGGGTVVRQTSSTLFDIEDTCTLNLDGITVDGRGNTFSYPLAQTTADDKVSNIIINNTTIKGINMDANIGRGVITIFANSSKKGSRCNLTVTNSVFEDCSAFTGAAILFQENVRSAATISNTIFRNNDTAQGGVIRTSGSSGVSLTLNQCVFKSNVGKDTLFSNKIASYTNGAAIYWNACGTDLQGNRSAITITDCQFINNSIIYGGTSVEDGCGGAIYNEAFMTINSNTTSNFTLSETTPGNIRGNLIAGNTASNMGGGIMVPTYSGGMAAHEGYGATLTLDESVFIINNNANKGGGIAMSVGLGSVGGSNPETSGVEYIITCDGAVIQNNTAYEIGGGIYLEREAGKDYFPSTVELLSGTISGNTAPNGGAIGVYNASNSASQKKNEINIGSNTGSLIIDNNTSTSSGGAIYVYYGNVNMFNGTLTNNTSNYGGAISVENGHFEMSGGTIQDCDATTDGGAVSVFGGNFDMANGIIKNCSADNGGAIYVEGGNINVYNGVMDGNTANTNGGAIYAMSNTQNITINIYDGEITNNSAGKHAGAIGANVTGIYSATINIGLESCLSVNKDRHDDKSCPILKNNTAAISGGAICLHAETENLAVNIYCGHITDNIAVRYEGTNSINQEGGTMTVYGGEIDAGISIGLGSYIDLRPGSSEKVLIIRLWSNYDGGPSEPVLINCTLGVSLNLPATVYTWEGHTLSGWTINPEGSAGWNPVGGRFVVEETDVGYMDMYAVWDAVVSYIVYIPDTVTVQDSGVGTMDINADLNYFKENSTLEITLETDFQLKNVTNSLDVLNYEVRTSEKGVAGAVRNGDLVASFQYDNTKAKTLTLSLLTQPKYANQYRGLLTFIVDYYEIDPDD